MPIFKKKLFTLAVIGTKFFCVLSFEIGPMVGEDDVLAYGNRYFRGPRELVRYGRVQGGLLKAMDIKGEVFYADFNWDNVFKALPKKRVQFSELNKYPSMRRDLALVVNQSVKFSEVAAIAGKTAKKLLRESNLFDVCTDFLS